MGRWDAGRWDVPVSQVLRIVKYFPNAMRLRKIASFGTINANNCYY